MEKYDVVVVGASAAGVTAALTARRHYPDKTILSVRKDEQVSVPCGIPYVFGTVGSPEKNLIPIEEILPANKIDGLVDELVKIDRQASIVETAGGKKIGYGKLILATGSTPVVPPIPGYDKGNILPVSKEVAHLERMSEALPGASDLVVVGCGFIGAEFAEECRKGHPNLNVTIVEVLGHCLQLAYDEEYCAVAEEALKEQGIALVLGDRVKSFEGVDNVEKVLLESGKEIKADVVILGIGCAAKTGLAEKAGLSTGPTRGIQVNRYMQTDDENIFACGDCAEKVSFFDGKPTPMKLASIATMEARIAGANLFAVQRANMGVIGVFSTVLGGSALAAAGLTESQARQKGYNVVVGEAEAPNRHPGCMPGAAKLRVKLVFEAGNAVLVGGQITGAKSGGELINAVSACINKRMTADDIATFQTGTHPALTASPIAYQLVNAAEAAIQKMTLKKSAR